MARGTFGPKEINAVVRSSVPAMPPPTRMGKASLAVLASIETGTVDICDLALGTGPKASSNDGPVLSHFRQRLWRKTAGAAGKLVRIVRNTDERLTSFAARRNPLSCSRRPHMPVA